MSLLHEINSAHMLRPRGIPQSLRGACIISLAADLRKMESLLSQNPRVRPEIIIIPDLSASAMEKAEITLGDKKIPALAPAAMTSCPELEKIFICPDNPESAAAFLSYFSRYGASAGVDTIYLFADKAPAHTERGAIPDFYRHKAELLEESWALFADDASRKTFAGRIKTLLTGNSGYIPVAAHEEYFHPLAHPEEGDILIDGGVSDMVQAQEEFSKAVGSKGHVFGFEPIPSMARIAAKKLAPLGNYHLQCAGLAEKPGKAVFEEMRDSSCMSDKALNNNGVECVLESIDDFCRKNHLGRVDCIKLDVEGAELAALRGAEDVLRASRPKLIVCMYHKPEDMYEIPLYLKNIVPEYDFFLSHSSCQFMDTVLYARVRRGMD